MNETEDAEGHRKKVAAETQPPIQPLVNPIPVELRDKGKRDDFKEKISQSDRIMVSATIVIALGTLVSAVAIGLQWREMVGGGHQTHQIIKAANKSKDAAEKSAQASRDFADTAAEINAGISDAVGK